MIKKIIATSLSDALRSFFDAPSKVTFYALSDKDKQYLSTQYEKKFTNEYFLSNPCMTAYLQQAAKELNNVCPTGRVFALGQSPAWIVFLASQLDDCPNRFGYIPFSGKWIRISGSGNFEVAPNVPSDAKVKCYQKNLEKLGLSPQEIVRRFESNGETTTIVDYVLSGCALESFKQIYKDWIDAEGVDSETFHKACQFLILNEASYITTYETNHGHQSLSISRNLVFDLTQENKFKDRFVPSYPHSAWQETHPNIGAYNPENKALIKFKILEDCLPSKE